MSFFVDTGFTMFGLVNQDYTLPEEVMKRIGIHVFQYDEFEYQQFEVNKFEPKQFEPKRFNYSTIDMCFLRRGVIGVSQIGYIIKRGLGIITELIMPGYFFEYK